MLPTFCMYTRNLRNVHSGQDKQVISKTGQTLDITYVWLTQIYIPQSKGKNSHLYIKYLYSHIFMIITYSEIIQSCHHLKKNIVRFFTLNETAP